MKPLTFFYLPDCPFCLKARRYLSEILSEHPEYASIPMTEIDESEQPELADTYDYYFVPCFFLEGHNLFEGIPTKQALEAVLSQAFHA